jgi:hypothetical protein
LLTQPGVLTAVHSCVRLLEQISQAAHSALAAGSFYSRFLDPSLARLAFLSRDPAACSGLHATPVDTALSGSNALRRGLTSWGFLWIRQHPQAFRPGFVPVLFSQNNPSAHIACAQLPVDLPTASSRSLELDFSLLSSVSLTGPSRFPQSRPCGVLGLHATPVSTTC